MKTRNTDIDQYPADTPYGRRPKNSNSFLAGVATVLVLQALGVGGFLLYQTMQEEQASNPFNRFLTRNNTAIAPAPEESASLSSEVRAIVQQNPYLQLALGNKAIVELSSAKRIPGTPDEVTLEMQIYRLADKVVDTDTINIGATSARNPITSETYRTADPLQRSSGTVSLSNLPKGQTVDAYVVLKVPPGVRLLDIFVDNTQTFKNIPVADASSAIEGASGSLVTPSNDTSPLGTVTIPGTPSNPALNPATPLPPLPPPLPLPNVVAPAAPTPNTPAPAAPQSGVETPAAAPTQKQGNAEQNPDANKLVQKAYGNKAQIQITSANRMVNPQTGERDLVNVQMRIDRLADEVDRTQIIPVGETTAINPVSSINYHAANTLASSTASIPIYTIPRGESVNAYVSLRVPQGVHVVDIYIPNVGTFKQVEIANAR